MSEKTKARERERGKRRQKKQQRRREKEKKQYKIWKYYTRDQKEVARHVRDGDYEVITGQGTGLFDGFFQFLRVLGVVALLEINGEKFHRKMMAISQFLLLYQAKILTGISSINAVPDTLLRDVGLLQLLGFTAKQISEGTNQRWKGQGKEDKHRIMNGSTLADVLERVTAEEMETLLNESIKLMAKHRLIHGGLFALDATDLITTKKYKGCGQVTRTEKVVNKKGQVIEIEVTRYGWKLLVLFQMNSRIVVAAKVVQIQNHEAQFPLAIIDQAQKNLGRSVSIKTVVMDRGFIDGMQLWALKNRYGIDFVIPARSNMEVAMECRKLRGEKADKRYIFYQNKREHEKKRDGQENMKITSVMGIAALSMYDAYGPEGHELAKGRRDFQPNPINAVMVICWKGHEYFPGHEPVFLTSLPIHHPLQIIDSYDERSLIENTCFRELKQGWHLQKYPKKTEDAVRNHVLLTVMVFSLCNAFRSQEGQDITEKGIRRFRRQHGDTIHKVVVFAGDFFAIFDIEELMILLGKPPKYCFRTNLQRTKKNYDIL